MFVNIGHYQKQCSVLFIFYNNETHTLYVRAGTCTFSIQTHAWNFIFDRQGNTGLFILQRELFFVFRHLFQYWQQQTKASNAIQAL